MGVQDTALQNVLVRARELKFLGPSPLSSHVDNGRGFARIIDAGTTSAMGDIGTGLAPAIADLGSGGGVPALVIACELGTARLTLIERGARRCEFLRWAVDRLALGDRVQVVEGEAEDVARSPDAEGSCSVVTARAFAPPAVTAECATRLLAPGGLLVVSEPPTDETRWPADECARLGLEVGDRRELDVGTFQILRRSTTQLDERFPRRPGTTRKRPLW